MIPVSFDESNVVIDKPATMTREQCEALSAWVGTDVDGFQVIISCWKLTQDEIEVLVRTGRIWVFVYGHGVPAMSISAHRPWPENKDNLLT